MQSFSYFDHINFKGIDRHSKLERRPFFKTQLSRTPSQEERETILQLNDSSMTLTVQSDFLRSWSYIL
jgi:hypothetical protein